MLKAADSFFRVQSFSTWSIKRALDIRDEGCCFPGCSNTRYVDAHHIQHWADGGETSLENLATLCRFHHRQLHLGEYTVTHQPETTHQSEVTHPGETSTLAEESTEFIFTDRQGNIIRPTFRPQFNYQDHVSAEILSIEKYRPEIDSSTCKTKWRGEGMDYGMAIDGLLTREDRGQLE